MGGGLYENGAYEDGEQDMEPAFPPNEKMTDGNWLSCETEWLLFQLGFLICLLVVLAVHLFA